MPHLCFGLGEHQVQQWLTRKDPGLNPTFYLISMSRTAPCLWRSTSSLTCQSQWAFQACAVLSIQPWELSSILCLICWPSSKAPAFCWPAPVLRHRGKLVWMQLPHASATTAFPGQLSVPYLLPSLRWEGITVAWTAPKRGAPSYDSPSSPKY